MQFLIADTFTDSLGRLTGDEQKAVKQTAFDLQVNPANPGMQFHRLSNSKDKDFWSARVTDDIRLVVHKTAGSLLLCYVDHHDKAYRWAERRKLETHPKTGAVQFVEVRERIEEIRVPKYVDEPVEEPPVIEVKESRTPLFGQFTDDELLGYGVPPDWVSATREVNDDTALLSLIEHLPQEASEALLELATGGKPEIRTQLRVGASPFSHPDSRRRFQIVTDVDELRRALDFPWDKWTVFLHPDQRELVERDYTGPAKVSGSAGTGKTIVALHRAVFLARQNPESRVLLATFTDALANALHGRLKRLISNEPQIGERLDVRSLNAVGVRLYRQRFGEPKLLTRERLAQYVRDVASALPPTKFSQAFLAGEWWEIVDAWQLGGWESYRDVKRLGRKTRLSEQLREKLWQIFSAVNARIQSDRHVTNACLFTRLASDLRASPSSPYDFVVIDEAQDISIAQLRFVASVGHGRPQALFFAGDLGQRIFQTPFSWKGLGVDVRGRSRTLKVNYRTSHQIRQQADRLLEPEVADVDGNNESRRGTVSVFSGPPPTVTVASTIPAEIEVVSNWINELVQEGVELHEIALIVRSGKELPRATGAAKAAGVPYRVVDDNALAPHGSIAVCTMHLAKGLEFRAVAVMACDDEIVPSQDRLASVTDEADLEEVYATERHLFYVAITRARDYLLVTSGDSPSEFLDDLSREELSSR